MTITRFESSALVAHEVSPAPPGYIATSSTSLTTSTGAKTFTTQAGTAFRAGQRVRLVSRSHPTYYLEGDLTSYSGTTMQVYATYIGPGGAGTFTDWDVVSAGSPGSGDVLSTNNGSEFNPQAFMTNMGFFRDPIFIMFTGQSNAANSFPDDTVAAPSNLYIWNQVDQSEVGTAFTQSWPLTMWFSEAAIRLAQDNPLRDVYVLCIAVGSQPVEQWLPSFAHTGEGYVDMATTLENNMTAALAVLASKGITKIDAACCWMGESNAFEASEVGFFKGLLDQLQARWRGFSWFPQQTPIFWMGFNPFYELPPATSPTLPQYSRYVREWCDADLTTRTFVDTSTLPTTMWDTADPHMSQSGYRTAGYALYRALTGQVEKAPATQYIAGDSAANPTITFDTPGDLAVTYSVNNAEYYRMGQLVAYRAALRAVLGFTTASGNIRIGPLPFKAIAGWIGKVQWGGITKADYTEITFSVVGGQTYANLMASGSGKTLANVTAANLTSGQTIDLEITALYLTDDWFDV